MALDFGFEMMTVRLGREVWWRAKGLPYNVWVRAGRPGPNGRLRCSQLLIETQQGSELKAREVQKIPLGRIMDELQLHVMSLLGRRNPVLMGPELRAELERLWPDPSPIRPTARRSITSRALLEEVAAEYRALVKAGDLTPIKTLATKRHRWKATRSKAYPDGHAYSAANIRRLRRLCVSEGLLGPSIHGKAGEKPTKRRKR